MPDTKQNLYNRAGIADVAEFYRTKFVSDEVLDARYFKALDRFDIRFARTMWIYDNVRPGSKVLELGCGAGMLALLKRKGVVLTGVDLSNECALAARRNGYDATFLAALSSLPFAAASFDYVVSLDVLGHVESEEKDAVLAEIKRVLRAGGVTMHGIECTDRASQKTYDEMSADELRRFIEVDGHVGLEEEQEHAARFERFFSQVAWEPRYALSLSSEEFLKQADRYGLGFEDDFLDYLRGLSFKERRAFDMAMGYVFAKVSDLNLHLPKSGLYVFLKASDEALGPFYNEHRDRRALFSSNQNLSSTGDLSSAEDLASGKIVCLDRSSEVTFDDGWYEPNLLPPIARWMSTRGRVNFRASSVAEIRLDITTHLPDLGAHPLGLEIFLNSIRLCAFSLWRYGWLELSVALPEALDSDVEFELELRADRTWQPRPVADETRDDRELSVAVCNIQVISGQ
ncbi:MAG TPA: methyltransferase domain-containing protein [Pyrinomonadaceae bacterium]|jgi:cyclopropane fatty-acyl-phospholipid synthase-like methyltransferase|nr:methyltransferase domain-containing protein [Pyrinomonadaceae bacterium]